MSPIIVSQASFFISLLFFGIGACLSFCTRKNDARANLLGNSFAILGSIAGLVSSFYILLLNTGFSFSMSSFMPLLSFSFLGDKLAGFFIFIISLIALIVSVYALGYVKHFYGKYNIGTLGFFYNIFLAGMMLTVTAHNAAFFLVAWEIMSLASYFLVIYEHKEKENLKAGSLYFVMTHAGTACIMLAFLLMYGATGSFDFSQIKEHIGTISPAMKSMIFLLALVGFGTKAGIIPLHIWLPSAHPAAPSHVSALMSGVMIKMGIYMMIRVFLGMLMPLPLWWGLAILIIGGISSLLGVLYALTEHDLKKLLAYHSIENIGIILLGFGSAMVFSSLNMLQFAALGLVAALFHTINHAVFKSLLFLGAGSVVSQTHTRNIEEYGGLIKRMPKTALSFLIGSAAISALPPLNGFFSEWMTFQALFEGIRSLTISTQWVFIFAAASLVFTGGLAAACFVKAFGITFLARPRSKEAANAKESGSLLTFSMLSLAGLTLVLGVLAGPVSSLLSRVVNDMGVFGASGAAFSSGITAVRLSSGFSSVSMPLIFGALAFSLFAVLYIVYAITKKRKVVIGRTWDCGTDLTPRMEISATGFSRSLITVFRGILRPTQQTNIEYRDGNMRYFPKTSIVRLGVQDIYRAHLYRPVQALFSGISEYMKRIQGGNINVYIFYIFIVLIILFVFAAS
ncbi:MAG: hydrogenase 4 subunit B [Candidatus Wildermuthbacteria bacterium]|nr:hydrogenase 4 subunit B [Candidatus Wildermuthbacteria bacterium]